MTKMEIDRLEPIGVELPEQSFDIKKILANLLDHYWLIIISLIIALIIAFFLNRYTTPVYVIETSLLIKAPREMGNSVSALLYGEELFARNSTNLENEGFLFKSFSLIDKTLRDLKLDVKYFMAGDVKDSELYTNSPLVVTVYDGTKKFPSTLLRCKIHKDLTRYMLEDPTSESFSLSRFLNEEILNNPPPEPLPFLNTPFNFNEEIIVDGYHFKIDLYKSKLLKRHKNEIYFQYQEYRSLTKYYRGKVDVNPLSDESSILKITMEGSSREKSKNFLNRLVQNYIERELERKNNIATRSIDFINGQILFMSDSLSVVESKLETFKKQNSTINLTDEVSSLYQSTQQFERERSVLTLNNQYLSDLQGQVSNNNLDQIIIPSSIGIEDANLNRSVQELVELQLQIRVVQSDKNLNNPLIRTYQQRIAGLRENILENIKSVKANNGIRIGTLNNRIGGLRSSISNLPTAERELISIQRNYQLSEDLYLFLMQKKAEAGIAKASNTVDYTVIDVAQVKGTAPVKPSPILNYATALLMGLLIPSLFVVVSNLVNNKITSKDELQALTKIPSLGVVARGKGNIQLINKENSRTALAESFRSIRSNLRYLARQDGDEGKVFLITSSMSGEGKTFCANNLAYIFSNFGKSVLLIDTDMRKVSDYTPFGIDNTMGLSDYLAGFVTEADVIQETAIERLSMITSGPIPPNPSELLLAGGINALLATLKMRYDYIIIDTPPIGLLSDCLELIDQANLNIFIVRKGVTFKKQLDEVNELHKIHQLKNMAMLLNGVNFEKLKYGYGYYEEFSKPSKWKKMFRRQG